MKRYFFICLFLCSSVLLWAQEEEPVYNNEEYSLVDDHIFGNLHDFYGYTFVPAQGKLQFAHYPDPVPAGWVRFYITKNQVTILERTEYRPGGIQVRPNREKEYTLRIVEVEDRGVSVKFKLVDLQYPDLNGFLELNKDGLGRVIMAKYFPGPGEPERIYIMKYASEEQLAADKEYFTHQEDIKTNDMAPFWGKTIYPFLSYDNYYDYNSIKINRVRPDDGININFFEKTVIGKKDKEITVQYISFVEKGEKKMQLIFKEANEVLVNHRDGNRKALELTCMDEITREQYYIILHRGALTYLKSMEVQLVKGKNRQTVFYYTLRPGAGTPLLAAPKKDDKKEKDNEKEADGEAEDKKEGKGLFQGIFSKNKEDEKAIEESKPSAPSEQPD